MSQFQRFSKLDITKYLIQENNVFTFIVYFIQEKAPIFPVKNG